jgi:hypothetical protein
VAEVPSVLWSLQTMPNWSTSFTLFFMVYGVEIMLPIYLQYGSPRVKAYQLDVVEEAQKDVVHLLEESRDIAITRSAGYQQALQ